MRKCRVFSLVTTLLFSLNALAQEPADGKEKEPPRKNEISDILDSMGYPELQVVPRASERLEIEAKSEDSLGIVAHWPVQLSGLATLYVGFASKGNLRDDLTPKEKSDSNTIASVTTAVGAGWIIGAALMGAQRPYRSGVSALKKYPGKDERSMLLRERLAEEALEKPARTMRVLQTFSVISNVTVNIASGWHANESGKITAGVGLLLSFLPYVFEDHSIDVYEKHLEYKRKIYTPLKSAYFTYDSKNKSLVPMTGLAWEF